MKLNSVLQTARRRFLTPQQSELSPIEQSGPSPLQPVSGPSPLQPVGGPSPLQPVCTIDWRRGADLVVRIGCFYNRGIVLPVIPGIFSESIGQMVTSGQYEAYEASMLDALIQPGEVILEIGAGCGFISAYCAKNPHTKVVHCVEANPNLIDVIKLTHQLNNVEATVYNEILGKEDGEADFFLHRDFWASGTHSFLGNLIKVKVKSFQCRLDAIRPTMLVIDIEGGEETLFEEVNLTGVKKILLELHQATIGRRGMKKVFDLLSSQDFHYEVWHSSHSLVTFSHIDRV